MSESEKPINVVTHSTRTRSDAIKPVEPRSYEATDFIYVSQIRLTARQIECLYWVFQGKSASDIGGILGISGRVVEEHLQKAAACFGVKSRHQAAWRAHELGLFKHFTP